MRTADELTGGGMMTGEPLVGTLRMPLPHQPLRDCGGAEHPRSRCSAPVGSPTALSRLRWWLGHQASFVTWRLIARALTGILRSPVDAAEQSARARILYDAYSALFVYASSCGPQTYRRVLRPAMRDADPAFTGRWARDYAVLPPLLRAVKRHCPESTVAPIVGAVRLNHRVHLSVAQRLVPGGHSLLRETGRAHEQPAPDDFARFDRFFHTERGPMCYAGLLTQYLDRLGGIVEDIERNGLFLEDGDAPSHSREVTALEQRLPQLFVELHEQLHGELHVPSGGGAVPVVC